MHVPEDQVNINGVVAFMKPECIQKTQATIDISIQANLLHLLLALSPNEKG